MWNNWQWLNCPFKDFLFITHHSSLSKTVIHNNVPNNQFLWLLGLSETGSNVVILVCVMNTGIFNIALPPVFSKTKWSEYLGYYRKLHMAWIIWWQKHVFILYSIQWAFNPVRYLPYQFHKQIYRIEHYDYRKLATCRLWW